MLALEGIKILDLSRYAPGHLCTMILGDFGAEVLKIEAPPVEGARIGMSPMGEEGKSEAAYNSMNRNKKSIVLNLRMNEARQIFYQLVEKCDVILESFRPGVVKRLGIDYKTTSKLNPRIIYCSMSGYGQDGPYKDLPGHDINYISVAGALSLIGEPDGRPVVPLNILGDFAGGSFCPAIGILIALMAREKSGKGQYIDLSMTDGIIALLTQIIEVYFWKGLIPERGKTALSSGYPYNDVYETKDGKYISIGGIDPPLWANLCRELGREDLIPYAFTPEHPFKEAEGDKWKEISAYLREQFLTQTRDEWFEMLWQKNIPISKVYTLDEVFLDPQVIKREMALELDHPSEGKVKQIGFHLKLSDTPAKFRTFAPLLGQHTEEVLLDLGYSSEKIEELRQKGVIG